MLVWQDSWTVFIQKRPLFANPSKFTIGILEIFIIHKCLLFNFPNNRPFNKTGLTYLKTFYLYLLDFDLLSKMSNSLHTMVIEITRVQFGLKIKSTGLSLEAMRRQKPTSCQTILVLKERYKYFWTDYSSINVWITKLTQICPMVLEIISQRV